MLLDYRWLWEEGPAPDADAPRARVVDEQRVVRPEETRRVAVEPEQRVVVAGN